MVNYWVFKDDESETDANTYNRHRVCPLLVGSPLLIWRVHAQSPLLAHYVHTICTLMHCGPHCRPQLFVYLCHTTVSYGVKSYYPSNRMLHVCALVSRDILNRSTWNFYSVSSNSKLSSPVNLISFRSFVAAYEFRGTYFWDYIKLISYFFSFFVLGKCCQVFILSWFMEYYPQKYLWFINFWKW